MKTLCVLGSINVDHVIRVPYFPKSGETLAGHSYQIAYGGKGANQAVAAARLGAKVKFIGAIGDDAIGQTMKSAFEQDGIDTQAIEVIPNQSTGLAMIQVSDEGENSIVISAGANANLSTDRVAQQRTAIELADILLMQLESPLQAVEFAAKIAKKSGTLVVLNPAPAQALSDELLACVDIITPNETEAEILTGVKVENAQTAAQASAVFHQKGIMTVLITLGAKGVYLSEQGRGGEIIRGFHVQAIDTTAAGDTFNGGFVTALLEGKTLSQAIRFAHAAAAISVTRLGAQTAIPYRSETLAFLSQHI
ncbi:Ribokinase [Bibersteinia trehalosi USDA-ARS-USMARC-188]|uniref:Ribokinase n=2 Tax=Bibersteinia trehalosi TaxID=47735 RepID=A0A4V7ICQ1_BIBTR|nr:ribokinase [Bibersteinia trehalosi]AGH37348.1 Ribokinase [Bibersteinia trehalosi USDA-ARS-USMARC-192]AHG82804.1 Ribokinase [Bibersteinia trehalosi USDA-ARS-USMARC-188]AHG85178.1 Ribokinase [Bibersteinia trehalosi USDA-ARS-USMARC-189]